MTEQSQQQDIQALAKGGRTNILGFLLRLGGTAPFLFIAARLYGKVPLGRFAAALVMMSAKINTTTINSNTEKPDWAKFDRRYIFSDERSDEVLLCIDA